jgi:hypothetical protein
MIKKVIFMLIVIAFILTSFSFKYLAFTSIENAINNITGDQELLMIKALSITSSGKVLNAPARRSVSLRL